ncbi:hypothetical protein D3C75_1369900 [compost metagenome]
MVNKSDAHGIHQRIALVAFVEHDFPANGRDADTVAVACNAGDHMLEQIFYPFVVELAEAQGIQQGNRP